MIHTLPLPAWAEPYFGPGLPGRAVLDNVADEDYHNTPALVSKSALDIVNANLERYRWSLDQPPAPDTDATRIGRALHCLALEPEYFSRRFVELPDFGDMRSSKNRELRDAWLRDEAPGKTPMSPHHVQMVRDMANSIRRHPAAKKLMRRGRPEVTACWTHDRTGLRCKSRADWLADIDGVFVDVKTAADASKEAFRRAAAEHRYHVQDAFYSRAFHENGIPIKHFVFVVVEKEPPYSVAVYQLGEASRLVGEAMYERDLTSLRTAIDSDEWPGYGNGVMDLDIPSWELAKGEAMAEDVEPEFELLTY